MRRDPRESAVHKFSKQRVSGATMSAGSSGGGAESPAAASTPSAKKSIPEPISVQGFFGICLYQLMRKPLLVPPEVRACVYLCAVAALSVVFDLIPVPRFFLANRRSLVNLVFVKWGWAWTFVCLAFYILFTSVVLTAQSTSLMRRHLSRLLFGTAGWYVCTNVFHAIENATGRCVVGQPPRQIYLPNVTDRGECQRQHAGAWLGFDISGHVFLLTWCNLVISEEAALLRDWVRLGCLLKEEVETGGRRLSAEMADRMWRLYQRHTFAVKCSAVCLSALSILWDLMLCLTVVYFHSMPSKLLAALCSVGAWAIVYRLVLPQQLAFVCPPGQSELRFIAAPTAGSQAQ